MLRGLHYIFSVIGLTEIKFQFDQDSIVTLNGNLVYDIADHLANLLIINKFSCMTSKVKIYKRDFSTLNESELTDQRVNWHDVLPNHDGDPIV